MDTEKIISELKFKAVRSSGAGGQNVNKVSSKIVLSFDLGNSKALSVDEIAILEEKLAPRLTNDKILILNSDEDRSQLKNKEIAIKKTAPFTTAESYCAKKNERPQKCPKLLLKNESRTKENCLKKGVQKKT